jgi:choline dehydrogenase-like flavoprotein
MAEINNLPALCSLEGFLKHQYDFIVVGGGTAGLVVAARLTENPNAHVGVLEAGPAHLEDPMIMMPAMYPKMIGDPKYDWLHKSVPQVPHPCLTSMPTIDVFRSTEISQRQHHGPASRQMPWRI